MMTMTRVALLLLFAFTALGAEHDALWSFNTHG